MRQTWVDDIVYQNIGEIIIVQLRIWIQFIRACANNGITMDQRKYKEKKNKIGMKRKNNKYMRYDKWETHSIPGNGCCIF